MAQNKAKNIKEFVAELLFPKFCFGCKKEGGYLCEDCLSLIDIAEKDLCPSCEKYSFDNRTCPSCKRTRFLDSLYFAAFYENPLVKKLILNFKYEPFAKELSKTLSYLLFVYFLKAGKNPFQNCKDPVLIPIPLYKKRLRWRGFNQSEEIAKEISLVFNVPVQNMLTRIKQTEPQIKLAKEQRKNNIQEAFGLNTKETIKEKTVFLIDDVFTSGSTMDEAARVLKKAGVGQAIGIAIARENKTDRLF